MSGSGISAALFAAGFAVAPEYLKSLAGLNFQQATSALLDSDFRKKTICDPSFPDDVNSSDGAISSDTVVQIVSALNIGQPSHTQSESSAPCTLQVKITDGHSKATALCLEPIPQLSTNSPPGSKIRIHAGTKYVGGKLILTPAQCTFLGGAVQALLDTWKANRYALNLRKTAGASSKSGNGPPKFDFQLSDSSKPVLGLSATAREGDNASRHETAQSGQRGESRNNPPPKKEKSYTAPIHPAAAPDGRPKGKAAVVRSVARPKAAPGAGVATEDSVLVHGTKNIYSDRKPSDTEIFDRPRIAPAPSGAAKRMVTAALGAVGGDSRRAPRGVEGAAHRGGESRGGFGQGEHGRNQDRNRDHGDDHGVQNVPPSAAQPQPQGPPHAEEAPAAVSAQAWPELAPVQAAPAPAAAPLQRAGKWGRDSSSIAARVAQSVAPSVPQAGVRPVQLDGAAGVNLMDFVKKGAGKVGKGGHKNGAVTEAADVNSNATWNCSMCTFENHSQLNCCEMCGNKR